MDQADCFCDGLKSETRKEVNYLRCSMLSEVIAHARASRDHTSTAQARVRHVNAGCSVNLRAPLLRLSTFQYRWKSARVRSLKMCRTHNIYFFCKEKRHVVRTCPKKRQS